MTLKNYSLDESKKLNQFCVERGLSDSSKRKYKICLKRYVNFYNMTLEDLIEEADYEEETIARETKRKIRERLIDFRVYLKQNYATNTLQTTMSSVNTFYKHFGISIPELPPITYDKSPNDDIEFTDLPNIDNIRQAIENVNTPKHKALFLFIACSGSARNETANFTFEQFRDGIREFYPDVESPEDIIKALDGKCEGEEPIIPCFKMTREKTQYTYYTIITPECTQFMINYLKSNGLGLKDKDSFFQLNINGITSAFRSLNNKMKWGKKGTVDFFSPHRLRKFNASVIEDTDLANYIQGRKPSRIKEAYFKKDKLRVREEYTKHIYKFAIYSRYDVMINSEAYNNLLKEKEQLEKKLNEMQRDNDNLASQVIDIQNQVDNLINANDITKIQNYLFKNDLVEKHNLTTDILNLYKEDVKKSDFSGVTDSYIEDLIIVAYNRVKAQESITPMKEIYDDELWKEIKTDIDLAYQQHMWNLDLEMTDGLKNKLDNKLEEYSKELWLNKSKVDENKVVEIIDSVLLR